MHLPHLENLTIAPREPSREPEQGIMPERGEIEVRQREIEDLLGRQKTRIDAQTAEIVRLRSSKEKYAKRYKETKERIMKLDHEIRDVSKEHEGALRRRDQRIREIADELARTKELLAARTTELSGAQSFLSTTDRLSEAEVLGIVRDLNENIFQVAANLTEEWEKLRSSQDRLFRLRKEDIDGLSEFYGPALVCHVLEQDPAAVTFLVQSCLCGLVARIASSWRLDDYEELKVLGSVYRSLCASGGYTSSIASEIRLTHIRGTSNLREVEVVDPQTTPRTTIPFHHHLARRRRSPMDHRIILVYSALNRIREKGSAQWGRNHRSTRTTLSLRVYGGHHIQ